jgi:hypothetical protein
MKIVHYSLALVMAVILVACPPAMALTSFPSEDIVVLEVKDIAVLTDEKLVDNYIDILSEIEATRAFHATSGFTLKEYAKYKDIVKYRLRMLFEINHRKLEIPAEVK